jgi:hypothetical protein
LRLLLNELPIRLFVHVIWVPSEVSAQWSVPHCFHLMTTWPLLHVHGPASEKAGEVTVWSALKIMSVLVGPSQIPTSFAQADPLPCRCFAAAEAFEFFAAGELRGSAALVSPAADLPCLPMVPPVLPDWA